MSQSSNPDPQSTWIQVPGLTVQITIDSTAYDPSDLQWIDENLSNLSCNPQSQTTRLGSPKPRPLALTLRRNLATYQSLRAQRSTFTLPNPCFSLHDKEIATYSNPNLTNTIYDSELDVFYLNRSQDTDKVPHIEVIARTQQPSARVAILRIVREFSSHRLLAKGWIPLHASAVTFHDRAILILGQRRAGKSTLMLQLLRDFNCKYIANDRVFIDPIETPKPGVYPIPGVVNVRASSLALFPPQTTNTDAKCNLWSNVCSSWRARQTLAEAQAIHSSSSHPTLSDLSLSTHQYLHLVGSQQVSFAPAALFVFPSQLTNTQSSWKPMSTVQLQSKLAENLFPISSSAFLKHNPTQPCLTEVLQPLAQQVSGIELQLECGKLAPPEILRSTLEQVLR